MVCLLAMLAAQGFVSLIVCVKLVLAQHSTAQYPYSTAQHTQHSTAQHIHNAYESRLDLFFIAFVSALHHMHSCAIASASV